MSENKHFAELPEGASYAVIFSALHCETESDTDNDYDETAAEMARLAAEQPGFRGFESTLGADGFGITVSYWRDQADIAAWRAHLDHTLARRRGRGEWYRAYRLRVARVERDLAWDRPTDQECPES